jgi:hypothetical protein
MANKITLVTPPDMILNRVQSILLITPGIDIKNSLEHFFSTIKANINVYIYDEHQQDHKWLLTVAVRANAVIVDCDNVPEDLSHFLSYVISMPNTYYRITNPKVDYLLINPNRFHDFPDLRSKIRSA